ncbi:hypothetical protein [Gelria sp. Kuro-4]|uniref:hypothetical protein n=1 Tax=Gelria sp. Kuro-4 TaxID=2796927 RepID=UPI001BEE1D4F|nr:hypothetical protein [Gelria sp. Kuro-4]BCV24879.1 hypothetical protein kuro4_16520 [Gelria sp. Kuro-4]
MPEDWRALLWYPGRWLGLMRIPAQIEPVPDQIVQLFRIKATADSGSKRPATTYSDQVTNRCWDTGKG